MCTARYLLLVKPYLMLCPSNQQKLVMLRHNGPGESVFIHLFDDNDQGKGV